MIGIQTSENIWDDEAVCFKHANEVTKDNGIDNEQL